MVLYPRFNRPPCRLLPRARLTGDAAAFGQPAITRVGCVPLGTGRVLRGGLGAAKGEAAALRRQPERVGLHRDCGALRGGNRDVEVDPEGASGIP